MAAIELKSITKSFGNIDVIHGVDLAVEHGEFIVFVGPSGCGKSTLLRMICGLEPISSGTLSIGGKPMRGVPPAKRGVAMVFQNYALYPHMTVAENMGFSLLMEKVPKKEREARILRAAETLQLGELLSRKPKELSGGQRQRVAIGRAIVRDPQVFLFDEPLSNLDAELRVQMRLELTKLHRKLGATMIYVTHDQTEAMTLADRIVVLRSGVIEQVGTPLEIYAAPRNKFVAGFMGSPKMSFLAARLVNTSGRKLLLDIAGMTPGRVEIELAREIPVGDQVTLGVRPEHFRLQHGKGPRLDARVDFVERLGGESYLHAPDHPAGGLIVRQGEAAPVRPEPQSISIGVDWRQVHLFTADGNAVELDRSTLASQGETA
ncbi:sn-glycerol-3-phosphate ABC transporter ATP-binding protein UgpC [Nordella sp. HKS 07]|uniref:ABC transporter ATP-binding protein n=1 Tax=Nordella sp. HKS 07 TaxID=2712222 RepID=UPI0013E1BD74|nr:sn-glycerol-3-phosphate ABC transporter ATP-binding protein UgpC [Nordella sp. HKS 07]QIG50796.1 sn-glycerol-3-phosphate ABC transporter ATP-binding protein UgpC [Nordella sp. HKS 07]